MSILSEQINHYRPLIKEVIDSAESKYFFTSDIYHQSLITKGQFAEANKNYALEIIFRFHAAALITLRRNLSWIESIESSRKHSAFFGFCASLRGLIESAADSFYSLRYAPQNLATYFEILKNCISGKESKKFHLFKELEDWGIHFLEAGKYEDESLEKEHFKAKSTWEYIEVIDSERALKPVYPFYQRLCQIAHPSRETTYFYFKNNNNFWAVEDIDEKHEIKRLEQSYDIEYEEVFQKSFNSALILLWIIDLFSIEGLRCSKIRNVDFSNIAEFRKIKEL